MGFYNLSMLTDFYQLTMLQGYHSLDYLKKEVVFDLFFRKNPSGNSFSVFAGLEQVIEYIRNIKFTEEDINYLKGLNCFSDDFLDYLKNFKFEGDIYATPEGTVVFPQEPMLRVKAPIMQAQIIETTLLNIINHQSLIATKAARVVYSAQGDTVLEFGLRRAQGPDAGVYGARAAVIGGCSATSNVLAGKMFGIPVKGTHAHSWVMSFPSELEAFRAYVKFFPNACTLLVDTYDTINSGVKNAIKVFDEMKKNGVSTERIGIRLDSGDIAYLSKKAREMLDEAGYPNAVITASNDLDEYLIRDLKLQGAKVTNWGVGTNLITSSDCPSFGGVYKLAAQTDGDGVLKPAIKLSDNPEKVTNPGYKKIVRFYDKLTGKIKADLIALDNEKFDSSEDLTIFDPQAIWKKMTLKKDTYVTRELLTPIFLDGKCVYESPQIMDIREYCEKEQATLWEEHRRLVNPHIVPVDLSQKLWDLKQEMIRNIRGE